jgi:hypothetical protein
MPRSFFKLGILLGFQGTSDDHLRIKTEKESGKKPGKKRSHGGRSQINPESCGRTSEHKWGRRAQPM